MKNDFFRQSGAVKANVDRMTDTKLYSGSHKERFDDEGKGKGIDGRKYVADTDGYVTGYKKPQNGK